MTLEGPHISAQVGTGNGFASVHIAVASVAGSEFLTAEPGLQARPPSSPPPWHSLPWSHLAASSSCLSLLSLSPPHRHPLNLALSLLTPPHASPFPSSITPSPSSPSLALQPPTDVFWGVAAVETSTSGTFLSHLPSISLVAPPEAGRTAAWALEHVCSQFEPCPSPSVTHKPPTPTHLHMPLWSRCSKCQTATRPPRLRSRCRVPARCK